ncbi:hypothetical protein SCP_1600930 [Sparassis crispa]|uniref:F-box domain-containing protein n=1 Tax=Sparassis crispa TaxID=139825 RepID=A0A401H4V8_9APHY|nr:hypothetical protein SCP_1600930 [Sparassis crispa]GBE89431.1 hypothetical protein SCP_1600930 [Sparassis crispa]
MNVLSLNHDVLSHILSFLVAKDALNLSVTSRKIYSIARRHAFSAVSLTSPAQLAEFCAYMLADVANRLFWLRDLEVCTSAFGVTSGEELEEEEGLVYLQDAALLAGLFAQATMLKCLSVSCIEVLVMSDSRIVEALIALPGLNKLQLSGTGPFTGQMLNKLRSRPRKLLLSFMERPSQSPLFFEHFASLQSLHVLDLWNIKLDEFPPSQNGALLQCPTVQHLSITASVAPMSLFVRAFPNLRTLLLWCVTAASLSPVTVTEDECWHRLNHVGGYTRDFTYWRVACPVRWLELDVAITDDTQVELVISAVRDMTPIILSLNIYLYTELSFWTSLAGAVPRLKYLDLVAMNWSISRCQRWLVSPIYSVQNAWPVLGTTIGSSPTYVEDVEVDLRTSLRQLASSAQRTR